MDHPLTSLLEERRDELWNDLYLLAEISNTIVIGNHPSEL